MNGNRFRHFKTIQALGLLFGLVFPTAVMAASQQRAQVPTPSTATLQRSKMATHVLKKTEPESKLSGSLGLSYSQSMVDYQDGTKSEGASGSFSLSYQVHPSWSLSTGIDFEQNLKDAEDTDNGISDLSIGLRQKSYTLAPWLSGRLSLSAAYPLSESSVKITKFQGSIGTKYSLSLTSEVLAKGWDASISAGVNRNFYEYETTKDGTILSPYSFRKTVSVGYEYRRWSFSVSVTHANRYNFENRVSERWTHSEDISFDILPSQWSVSIGHSNRTSWFSQLDETSNLDLIDDQSSKVFASTEFSF